MKSLKSEKYKLGDWAIHKNFFTYSDQDSAISHIRENSMFNITSKYFSFFSNINLRAESRISHEISYLLFLFVL